MASTIALWSMNQFIFLICCTIFLWQPNAVLAIGYAIDRLQCLLTAIKWSASTPWRDMLAKEVLVSFMVLCSRKKILAFVWLALLALTLTDRESGHAIESGFYMTSFAATIFIASLVTFKVLLVTMLVALSVMLQSCQSRSAGVVETPFRSHDHDDDACKALAVHAELNKFEAARFPVICRAFATRYIEEGQYERELNSAASLVENSLRSVESPRDDGLDVFMLDVDEVLSPNPLYDNLSLQR